MERKGGSSSKGGKPQKTQSFQKPPSKSQYYDNHLDIVTADSLIERGKLFWGEFRVNPRRRKVGYVTVAGIKTDILIEDEKARNRAIHGDLVALELLDVTQWSQSPSTMRVQDRASEDDDAEVLEAVNEVNNDLWLPRSHLLAPADSRREGTSCDAPESSSRPLLAVDSEDPIVHTANLGILQPKGKIVCILSSDHNPRHVGALVPSGPVAQNSPLPAGQSYVFFQPQNPRFPNMIIQRSQLPEAYLRDPSAFATQIYVAEMSKDWPASSKMPIGEKVRSLGEMGTIAAETDALLIENNLDHGVYTDEMMDPLREYLGADIDGIRSDSSWEIPEEEIRKRRDLRGHRIFTIDPPSAKDLDDALHITPLPDGNFEVGVHIADVGFFVREGNALDAEARKRSTSVYLVQKVVHMLPPVLCEQLCSLNPNVDRLAFSCIWKMRPDGTLIDESPWFGRTVIRSCAKLDYPTAQRMVDGLILPRDEPDPDCSSGSVGSSNSSSSRSSCSACEDDSFLSAVSEELWESSRRPVGQSAREVVRDVWNMHKVAMARREKRLSNGALSLQKPKMVFRLDSDGNPTEVASYIIRQSNQLIEEYMLLANYLVAQELITLVGRAALLRNHPPPVVKYLDELKELADHIGLSIDTSSSAGLQSSLAEIATKQDATTSQVITALLAHPFRPAEYIAAGKFDDPAKWRHYALSIPYYTHFTSPIRRYPDIMVHRLLEIGLTDPHGAALDLVVKEIEAVAKHCNEMKANSKAAQGRSDVVFLSMYLSSNPMNAEAVVIGIGEKSFTVLILAFGIEARLYVDEMEGIESSYNASEKKLTLVRPAGMISGRCEFDRLRVTLMGRLKVHMGVKPIPPVDVKVSLVGEVDVESEAEFQKNLDAAADFLRSVSIETDEDD